jgi:hypothetical protein
MTTKDIFDDDLHRAHKLFVERDALLYEADRLKKQAYDLLNYVEKERKAYDKQVQLQLLCKCGHKLLVHGHQHDVNYSAGVCQVSECSCLNFILK